MSAQNENKGEYSAKNVPPAAAGVNTRVCLSHAHGVCVWGQSLDTVLNYFLLIAIPPPLFCQDIYSLQKI